MKQEFNLVGVLKTLFTWRKPILYVTGAVAVLSVIFSLLAPVYFQGKTVFYAASQDLFKPEKVFGGSTSDMLYYGSDDDIDRILTLAFSSDVIHFLVDSFNLYEHYEIDPDRSRAEYEVELHFLGLYDVLQTKFDALELTYEDQDPELAAAVANAARERINALAQKIIKESQASLISSFSQAILIKEKALDKLTDSLAYYRQKYRIYSPEDQTELLSTRLTKVETSLIGLRAKIDALERTRYRSSRLNDSLNLLRANLQAFEQEQKVLNSDTSQSAFNLKRFNQAKGVIEILDEEYSRANSQLSSDRERLKFYQAGYALEVPAVHIIEEAEVPVVKHRPKRSILVMASTLAAFVFSVIGVLLFVAYKEFDWKEITG